MKIVQLNYILISIFLITSFRVFIEFCLLDYDYYIEDIGEFQNYMRLYLENIYYFFILFIIITAFISELLKKSFTHIANIAFRIFPLIILPPLIDHYIFDRIEGYAYATLNNFIYNIFTLSWYRGDASIGISIEITLAVICIGSYVYYQKKSILISIFSIFISALVITVLSTPEIFFGRGKGDIEPDYFLPLYYFYPLMMIACALYWIYRRENFLNIVNNLRPVRSGVFIVTVIAGFFSNYSNELSKVLWSPVYLCNLSSAVISILFVWWCSVIINDIYDFDIDQLTNPDRPLVTGIISKKEYQFISIIFAFFALSFSINISWKVGALVSTSLLFAVMYSVPPIRIRKHLLLGNILIGISLVISFMVGSLISNPLWIGTSTQHLIFYLLIALFGTVMTLSKDLKDIESDKKYSVKTFYTIFGKKTGKQITLVLIGVLYILPAILLHNFPLLIISSLLALVGCYLFYKKEDERFVYIIAACIMVYAFLHGFIYVKINTDTKPNTTHLKHNYISFTDEKKHQSLYDSGK